MILTRSCDHSFTGCEFSLLTADMKYAPASKNKVDLIRSSVTVNSLVLTGLKAVEIAKIIP